MKSVLLAMLSAAAVALTATPSLAMPSCTVWMWQPDGTFWRQCVNDDGSRHCYQATDSTGAGQIEITCS